MNLRPAYLVRLGLHSTQTSGQDDETRTSQEAPMQTAQAQQAPHAGVSDVAQHLACASPEKQGPSRSSVLPT